MVKRFFALTLTLALLLTATGTIYADPPNENTIKIVSNSATAAQFNRFSVMITVRMDTPLAGIEFSVDYDQEILELTDVTFPSSPKLSGIYDSLVSLAPASADGLLEDFTIINLVFIVLEDAELGETEISLGNVYASDADDNKVEFALSSGKVEIVAPIYEIELDYTGEYVFPAATVGYSKPTETISVDVTNTGNQRIGQQTVALSNDTNSAFTLSNTSLKPMEVSVEAWNAFDVAPKLGLPAGTYTATVTVSADHEVSASFDVSFTVNPAPDYSISLDPTTYDFGSVVEDGYTVPDALPVTVANTGNQETGELTVGVSGSSFDLSKTTLDSIAVDGEDTFTVTPKGGLTAGIHTATVTVSGGNGISASFVVSFEVEAASYGISLSQTDTYDFDSVVEDGYNVPDALSVAVVNTGNKPTGALTAVVSGSDFTLTPGSLPSIGVGETAASAFTVEPVVGLTAGIHTATVTVSGGNSISASFVVSFEVEEASYEISLSQTDTYVFDSVVEDGYTPPPAHSVTITNTGNKPTGALNVTLSGANYTDFTLSDTTLASIETGKNYTFTVTPKGGLTAGAHTATVTVKSSSNSITASFGVRFVVEAANYEISLNVTDPHTFPRAIVDYDLQTPLTVTIANDGNKPTGALTVTVDGVGFELSVDTIDSIAVGEVDTFTVTPSGGLSVGEYTATIEVSGDDVSSVSFDVSFTVDPTPTYEISLDAEDPHVFPAVNVDYDPQTALTVTITNEGNQPTGALTVTVDGAGFELSADTIASIAVGGEDTFTVAPSDGLAVGDYSATVEISGANGITASFAVSFTVNPAPEYSVSLSESGTYAFPAAEVDYGVSPALSVDVANTGNQPTGALTAVVSGSDFTLTPGSLPSIGVGETAAGAFTVEPVAGLATGTYTATVEVTGDEGISDSFDVRFTVNPVGFVAVSGISGVPGSAVAGAALELAGTVEPDGASGAVIVWTIKSAGATGAEISGNTLLTAAAGTVIVTATIADGAGTGLNYTQDFTIIIAPVQYTVTVSAGTGGSVSGGGTLVSGTTAAVRASANTGYTFAGWYENGSLVSSSATYSFAVNADRSLQARFTQTSETPSSNAPRHPAVSGSVSGPANAPAQPTTPSAPSVPALPKPPAIPPLNRSGGAGYISGYPDRTFMPNKSVTFYEAASMLYTLVADSGKSAYKSYVSQFSDVSAEGWYSEAIGYLTAADVITGYGELGGSGPMTRASFIVLLSKFGELKLGGTAPFSDVEGNWAYDHILSAYNNGWISGYPDGSFRPDQAITRAEAVTLINQLLGWPDDGAAGKANPFADIAGDEWYGAAVINAANGK
ncbi:MAG: S-layer homology domain-containing protein [Clostridiales bacterium]|jgi:uncharacterized membrane protein|nr:S-layer homology domain-containing protein [Clostridiales bacterium]